MASTPVTFIFLQDPQPVTEEWNNDNEARIKRLGQLNDCLNTISTRTWPNNANLTADVQGTAIGTPQFIIFGGDLCQSGGEYSALDQMLRDPFSYTGGYQLEIISWLFDKFWQPPPDFKSIRTRTNISPVYFGLGNHDMQNKTEQPRVHWLGFGGVLNPQGTPNDFWRYQMWNFICQRHTVLRYGGRYGRPDFPIHGSIDDGRSTGSYDWKSNSFNYHLNFGFFSIIQLHRYGGDSMNGRATGLSWLQDQLQSVGQDFPVIIVQHFYFNDLSPGPVDPEIDWTQEQANALLSILEPYNIIALLVGHEHYPPDSARLSIPVPNGSTSFDQFRPGISSCDPNSDPPIMPGGYFSLVRVASDSFNIQHCQAPAKPGDPIVMPNQLAFSKVVNGSQCWLFGPNGNDGNYFGPLGDNLFIDMGEVVVPDNSIVVGLAFSRKLQPDNRMRPIVLIAATDFDDDQVVNLVQNDDPDTNYINPPDWYADTTPVTAPPGRIVTGFRFVTNDNRFGVSLQHANPDYSDRQWQNADIQAGNSRYFKDTGGVGGIYVDTNFVYDPSIEENPTNYRVARGFQLWRKIDNRIAPAVLVQAPA